MSGRPNFGIGIETDFLNTSMTGVGNYCFHLLKAFMEDHQDVRFHSFSGLAWSPFGPADLKHIDRVHGKSAPDASAANAADPNIQSLKNAIRSAAARNDFARRIYRRLRRRQFQRQTMPAAVNLFHAFRYLPPIDLDVPVLPVIYDLSFVRFPETHPRERLKELERLPDVVARAPFIQTISEFSKAEIADVYGYPQERIIVIPPAASALFKPLGQDMTRADIRSLNLSPDGYLLAVGTLEPRKNLRTLIAAYAELSPGQRSRFPLVIAGNSGWGKIELPSVARRMISDGSLRFLGSVSDARLRSLYEGARALLFPSVYEGFGMPAVEALAVGTEVIHSSNTSMDEITEGASITVSATDVPGWAAVLKELVEDPSRGTAGREARVAQAQKFDWHRSADNVKQLYHRITTGDVQTGQIKSSSQPSIR